MICKQISTTSKRAKVLTLLTRKHLATVPYLAYVCICEFDFSLLLLYLNLRFLRRIPLFKPTPLKCFLILKTRSLICRKVLQKTSHFQHIVTDDDIRQPMIESAFGIAEKLGKIFMHSVCVIYMDASCMLLYWLSVWLSVWCYKNGQNPANIQFTPKNKINHLCIL